MSVGYQAVLWNRQKRIYDAALAGGILLYLGIFWGITSTLQPSITAETLLLRTFGSAALLLMHVVLCIGPLSRLDRRFLPFLYNRRHMGVSMFLLGLIHGGLSLFQFHTQGDLNPLVSLFVSNLRFDSIAQFPFQPLGFFALCILYLMAATSHDFWLHNLSAPVWKALHMMVYVAYALLILHVALGALQAERSPVLTGLLGAGMVTVLSVHLLAAGRERRKDRPTTGATDGEFVAVARVEDIPDSRAIIADLAGERVAVFRYDDKISALSNVCQHQNGPLGEGRVIDGCITCPWHGYQYLPESGSSPAPFTERVPTFDVRVKDGLVWVDPRPHAPGTTVTPASCGGMAAAVVDGALPSRDAFYVGYLPKSPKALGAWTFSVVGALFTLAALAATLTGAFQSRLPDKVFEWGSPRTVVGLLHETPVPHIALRRPGITADDATWSRYLLVGEGKRGAQAAVRELDGQWIELQGTLIFREDQTMLELVPGTIQALEGTSPDAVEGPIVDRTASESPPHDLGIHTLMGEIVDSKCYLGVMNPGATKLHRACAVRCISGGIPPVLLVRGTDGRAIYLLLQSKSGAMVNAQVLDFVAEPVEITGRVLRLDDLLVLQADPAGYRRLDP